MKAASIIPVFLKVTSLAAAVVALMATAAPAAAKKKPKPRVSVTAFSTQPLGSTNTVAPGGELKLCGAAAASTTRIYAYLRFRNLKKGRKVTSKWTHNGVFYAGADQTWSLASPGRAAAEMVRAPSQARFPSGLYRFSFSYSARRITSSTLTVNSDC